MSCDSLFMGKTKKMGFVMVVLEVIVMDVARIGKFIADLRKEQQLTQAQFGEKI